MLRGSLRFARAVVIGEGTMASRALSALRHARFCEEVETGAADASLETADLVFIDVDTDNTASTILAALTYVDPSALVTELQPLKDDLLYGLEDQVPNGYGYVSSAIYGATDSRTFEGATVALIPVAGSVPGALEEWRKVWEQLGAAAVVQLDSHTNDQHVAAGTTP